MIERSSMQNILITGSTKIALATIEDGSIRHEHKQIDVSVRAKADQDRVSFDIPEISVTNTSIAPDLCSEGEMHVSTVSLSIGSKIHGFRKSLYENVHGAFHENTGLSYSPTNPNEYAKVMNSAIHKTLICWAVKHLQGEDLDPYIPSSIHNAQEFSDASRFICKEKGLNVEVLKPNDESPSKEIRSVVTDMDSGEQIGKSVLTINVPSLTACVIVKQ